ncbi:unnamed protein product [Polarella glacialis]|uniref:Uncharacterized protein n=1 Tax=Polarella glacialis TaxID=89957 RepID=A0A813LW88_POLGL|nr:unnamed protein product [Polarella glacialis]
MVIVAMPVPVPMPMPVPVPVRRMQSFTEMTFPMYVMSMDTFLQLKTMRPHPELLAEGSIFPWSPERGPVNLLSHQWLGISHPDPECGQLRCIQAVFRNVLDGKMPFRRPQDWELYSKTRNYAKAAGRDLAKLGENGLKLDLVETFSQEEFISTIRNGCVWLDYAGVPQVGEKAQKVTKESRAQQQAAVDSIPAYVEASTNLWVVAPPLQHADLNVECNFETWRTRGWCRVEDWVNEFNVNARRPLVVEGPMDVWVDDFTLKLTSRAQRQHSALNGQFTCCRMQHEANGAPFPCDKPRVRHVISNTLEGKLADLKAKGDLVHYAWFLCLKPALLAETGAEGPLAIPKDRDLSAFLQRYCWKADIEGKDVPSQPVFFPLFCAATEGNLEAVKWLVEAKADVSRRLMGVGTNSLEGACISGHLEVCQHLLAQRAELHGSSLLDGNMPVHKAASGGSSAVLQMLLSQRAEVDACRKDGRTALSCASGEGNEACVRLLVEARADTAATDDQGSTALILAKLSTNIVCIAVLEEAARARVIFFNNLFLVSKKEG